MNGQCIFLDGGGRRCASAAQPGSVFCRVHAVAKTGPPDEAEPESLETPAYEPVPLPSWLALLRRVAAAALLAYFLIQLYLGLGDIFRH